MAPEVHYFVVAAGPLGQSRGRFPLTYGNSYTVVYNGNSNTSGTAPGSTSANYNTTVTVASNTGSLARTGYIFAGWNTAANGSGTYYRANTDSFNISNHITLYAHWTLPVAQYSGLKAYYPFNNSLQDASGLGNHLNYSFQTPTYTAAKFSNSFITGWSSGLSGQFAALTSADTDLDMNNSFSISVWTKWDGAVSPDSNNYIVYRGNSSSFANGGYSLQMDSSYRLILSFRSNTGVESSCTSNAVITQHTLTHIIGS